MSLLRRSHLSFANVVSCLALFIALGGGAYAASGGFVSSGAVRFCVNKGGSVSAVKSGKKCKRGSTTLLLNQKGVAGKNGANGANGAPGATGAVGPATGPAGGDLSGNYPNPLIGTAKVTSTKLADAAVTTTKLADESVTTTKLAPASVDSSRIQDGQVRAADLGSITQVTNVVGGVLNEANGTVTATCPTGTIVISGGGQPTFFGVNMTSSLRSGNGWEYQASNKSGVTTSLTAFAYCLQE